MFSEENDLFEIEENDIEFQEICSQLKNHAFPSPWNIFFKPTNRNEFTSEVSEFIVENDNLIKENIDINTPLPADGSPHLFIKNDSTNAQIDKKKICRLRESLLTAQENITVDNIKDFDLFFITPSSQIPELFKILDSLHMNDVALNLLLNAFLHFKDLISIATAIGLVHHVICPLIFDLKKNSSRFLLTTILKFAEAYPKAIIDEVLVPYSKKDISDDLESEILSQIVKTNLPNEYVSYGIKRVLECALPVDNTFCTLQYLIERKVYHENVLYDLLLQKLLTWTSTCSKNVKFTKLLTSILSAYGNEFTEQQISMCGEVVKKNKTIIKKAAENLLKKLKTQNL